MLFFSKMHWNLDGMTFPQLWQLEGEEARIGVENLRTGILQHLYKACAEHYVISVGESESADAFDEVALGVLPMREHLVFEEVWPLEHGFSADMPGYLEERGRLTAGEPRVLHYLEFAWPEDERRLDDAWPGIVHGVRASAGVGVQATPQLLGLYRVAGRQRVIAFVDVTSAAEISAFARTEGLDTAKVEKVWVLRDYLGFAQDVWRGYQPASR